MDKEAKYLKTAHIAAVRAEAQIAKAKEHSSHINWTKKSKAAMG